MFLLGMLTGAVVLFALLLIGGIVEIETTYEIEKDEQANRRIDH